MGARSQAAWAEFKKQKNGWKPHQIDAAEGGWEYVLDTCYTRDGKYDRSKMEGNGECEAMDLATGIVEEKPWRPQDRWVAADYVYDGMRAALKFIEESQDD